MGPCANDCARKSGCNQDPESRHRYLENGVFIRTGAKGEREPQAEGSANEHGTGG